MQNRSQSSAHEIKVKLFKTSFKTSKLINLEQTLHLFFNKPLYRSFLQLHSSNTHQKTTLRDEKKIAPFSISNDVDDDVKGERNPNWSIPVTATAPPFRNGLRILSFVPCQSPEHVWPWPEPVNENNFFQIFINTCPTVVCVVPCGGTRVCLVGMFVHICLLGLFFFAHSLSLCLSNQLSAHKICEWKVTMEQTVGKRLRKALELISILFCRTPIG